MRDDHLTDLALAASHGDDAALAEFVTLTQGRVRSLCAHLGAPCETDDLTQETYLRVVGALHRFRGESSAETWLLSIARHVCADHVRRRVRRTAIDRRQPRPDQFSPPEELVEFGDVLGRLDDDQRTAFVLTQVLGCSYAEAAEVCDCPVGTIRSRVARARQQLLAELADPGGAEPGDATG
ncbi:MAG: sigma-70 family RNA polymerase sigma factor [Actinomycetota bacterium]